jgi:signal transduction histidine kinase
MKTLIDRNLELLKTPALQKQISLNSLVPGNIFVYIDINMLDTVIRNLLSNAVKFTRPGGTVEVSALTEQGIVTVSVSDNGIGISHEKLPNLFRIDVKTQRAGTANEQGTGLGLILCKDFIEKHQGQLGIESEPEKGTTVWFSVPQNVPDECLLGEDL